MVKGSVDGEACAGSNTCEACEFGLRVRVKVVTAEALCEGCQVWENYEDCTE
jgi:hypothetical protein